MKALQGILKTFAKLILHRLLLHFTSLRVTVKFNFTSIGIDHPLYANRLARSFFYCDRLLIVKLTLPFATDHQIAIALLYQPGDIRLRGNAGVP